MAIKLNFITFIILLLIASKEINATKTETETETEHCPSYCKCDLYENLNRADCSGQQLITPNVEVPSAVELLDLSHNDITTLDNVCFEGLIYVINLTITHNALHTIYLDAFSSLREVKFIDLSHNRLEYFDERIFEANTKLTSLNLSSNKFMSLQNKPLLRSSSIKYLNLNNAQITYIYPQMFKEIPNLKDVDISNNLMITLSATAFNSLKNLQILNLEQNRWICDNGFDATLKLLKRKGIETRLHSCEVFNIKTEGRYNNEPHIMFERMMAAPMPSSPSIETEPEPKEFIPIENVWKPKKPIDQDLIEAEACEEQSLVKICHLHRSCLANLRILIKDKTAGEVIKRGKYTDDDLKFVFFTGIALGIAIFICLMTCALCIKRCFNVQKNFTQRPNDVVTTVTYRRPIPAAAPIVPPRQRRSNRRSRNAVPPLNRSLSSPVRRGPHADGNQSDFATFITRFFERPTRHQYYRTINENTAHMIRRLSQSNLFNNRRSRNFNETTTPNSSGEGEPFVYPLAIESRASLDEPLVHQPTGSRWEEPPARPETPPPAYGDVVRPKRDN
ncbi:uncharacterized protein LOC129907663 [Episyrphus balteatus]|uniref:uncharacterized protein LOC129907663 n=1 Tax=Episyrphus balteatus TaxID=286459 RepID=UPI0024863617|nr:uncharacterized protein LOC129907663 [Episyrphus balteatus]